MLAILIPARNEEYLERTIQDIYEHKKGDTEVLVALDNWENPPNITPREGLRVFTTALGQRAATNYLAKQTDVKYVMKVDAHCSFSLGFDVAMMDTMEDDMTLIPVLLNMRPYQWLCSQGHIQPHQNKQPEKCACGAEEMVKQDLWKIVPKPVYSNFCLDTNLVFQYCTVQSTDMVTETMAIQGSGFMLTREKYFELDICGEEFGSWGQQGAEVALKTWLSGGRVLCTKRAYMGHWFRGLEDFPYQRDMKQVDHANTYCKDLFLNNKWKGQKKSIQWLIERFNYPSDWSEENVDKLCAPFKAV